MSHTGSVDWVKMLVERVEDIELQSNLALKVSPAACWCFTRSPAPRRREIDYLSGSRTPLLRWDHTQSAANFPVKINNFSEDTSTLL